jgi:ABC-type glycerol-3-phosphate transport system permease component
MRVRGDNLRFALAYGVIIIGAIIICFPFYWQVSTSLKVPADLFRWPPLWVPYPPK